MGSSALRVRASEWLAEGCEPSEQTEGNPSAALPAERSEEGNGISDASRRSASEASLIDSHSLSRFARSRDSLFVRFVPSALPPGNKMRHDRCFMGFVLSTERHSRNYPSKTNLKPPDFQCETMHEGHLNH